MGFVALEAEPEAVLPGRTDAVYALTWPMFDFGAALFPGRVSEFLNLKELSPPCRSCSTLLPRVLLVVACLFWPACIVTWTWIVWPSGFVVEPALAFEVLAGLARLSICFLVFSASNLLSLATSTTFAGRGAGLGVALFNPTVVRLGAGVTGNGPQSSSSSSNLEIPPLLSSQSLEISSLALLASEFESSEKGPARFGRFAFAFRLRGETARLLFVAPSLFMSAEDVGCFRGDRADGNLLP
jgi:hypothetical protein